jgi:hypothetical protein
MTFAMSFEDRASAVAAFGFTPRQARFLTTVMLHSGVCLPRHYTKFAGIAFGHNTRDFFAKLTREKFATAYACWRRQGTYFHVHHKGLYRAIGEPDNRHRRRPTIPRTAERLMLLDIVLDQPELTWLGAEADKAVHFGQRHDVPREDLPSLVFEQGGSRTVRYFPDKLPIGIDNLGRVLFVYLVTDPNPDAVRRFMRRHRPLFRRVSQWTLGLFLPGYLAGVEGRVRAAVMESFAEPLSTSVREEFEWFCHARRAIEQGRRAGAAIDQVRYSRARRAFGSPRFYAAYRAWLKQGNGAFWDLMMPGLRDKLQCDLVRIETHVLPHRYLNVATAAMTA